MKKISIILLATGLLLAACSASNVVEGTVEPGVSAGASASKIIEEESAPLTEPAMTIAQPAGVEEGSSEGWVEPDTTAGLLSATEIEGLVFMREEEKLARDVYLTLYEMWKMPIFQNIAESESTHMAAVLTLLERYGLEDPSAGNPVGEFENPELQALYDELVNQGGQSLADALKVGAAIEEIDILDLEEFLGQAPTSDIVQVYESLLRGSQNHLRSFTGTFEQQTGEKYVPQYMSQEAYEAIIINGIETGGTGGSMGNGAGQSRNGRGREASL